MFSLPTSCGKKPKGFFNSEWYRPKRTHDIKELLEACAAIDPIFATIDPKRIDDFAVGVRYPDQAEAPELGEAQELFAIAISIKNTVVERIGIDFTYDLLQSNLIKQENTKKLPGKKVEPKNSLLPKKKNSESLLPKKRIRK